MWSGMYVYCMCRSHVCVIFFFFFFKQKTAYELRISDWSSDVCSSDLERWIWHVGLDAEGTSLLNDLYNDVEVGEGRLARLLSLFRMDFSDASVVLPALTGRPVYLALAMTDKSLLRLKPQNPLVTLPLAARPWDVRRDGCRRAMTTAPLPRHPP